MVDKGKVIIFLGPDGSGKSTLANLLHKEILNSGKKSMLIHWRHGILPKLSVVMNNEKSNDYSNPHKNPPQNKWISFFKLFYYLIDYLLGHYLICIPKKIRGYTIIYDRYFYDFAIDPKRFRLSMSDTIIQKMFFLPNPKYIFHLHASSKNVIIRKRDLNEEEINRQNKKIIEIFGNQKNYKKINADQDLKTVFSEIKNCLHKD